MRFAPATLHNRIVLIELVQVTKFPGTNWRAVVRTSFGRAAVDWRGDPAAQPGEYHVEWTIDEDFVWGRNAKPAADTGPGLRTGGHCVVLRGQLHLTEDGAALLDFDGTPILLDVTGRLPDNVIGTWVELFVEHGMVAVHPYEV